MMLKCKGNIVAEKDNRKIIDCRKCGYMHVYPMYKEDELEKFYAEVYSESTPSYLMHEKVYNIKKWKKKGSVLDIGCWEGGQLEFFKREGWDCTGIELNRRASAVATKKGMTVYNISIKQFFKEFRNTKWDVINAAYILEHIPSPADFLAALRNHIKDDGIIIVEVPNEFNPLQLAYIKDKGIKPYWIFLPDHVNYFNHKGIENLLERAGWNIIHGEVSFPMEMFLLKGDNYLEDNSIGKRSFKKVVEMESILRKYDAGFVSKLYSALYKCGVGRSIIIYSKLKNYSKP